jgi:drug/metabolite transporter (DMT)-like permease
MGYRIYSGAQMAAFRLCSGVVFVALVARFVLNEELGGRQLMGFGVMFVAMLLIAFPDGRRSLVAPPAGSPRDANE